MFDVLEPAGTARFPETAGNLAIAISREDIVPKVIHVGTSAEKWKRWCLWTHHTVGFADRLICFRDTR